jgi:membrane protease YdiL (CAAX protease family)
MTTLPVAHGDDAVGLAAARPDGRAVGWVRAHPIGAFMAWFFTAGWAIAFIPFVAKRVYGLEFPSFEPFIIASTWLGLLLPTVVITRLVDGPAGLQALFRRVLKVRVALAWHALAVLAIPLLAVALATIVSGPPTMTPSLLISAVASGLLVEAFVGGLTVNLWEETAWMGFVQARLQARHGAWVAVILTAALFALQHLPIVLESGAFVLLPVLFALMIPFRALQGWLYNRTGSLFIVGLLHAVGDATGSGGFGAGLLPRLYPDNAGDASFLSIAAQVLIGLAVIAATRARLGVPARAPRAEAAIAPAGGAPGG